MFKDENIVSSYTFLRAIETLRNTEFKATRSNNQSVSSRKLTQYNNSNKNFGRVELEEQRKKTEKQVKN